MTEAAESSVLTYLASKPDALIEDSFPWASANQLTHEAVVGAAKSLMADNYISTEDLSTSFYTISDEARDILDNGAQEMLVLKVVNEKGKISIPDLQEVVGKTVAKIGMGNCMKSKWIKKDGGDLVPLKGVNEVEDETQKHLKTLVDGNFAEDALDAKVSAPHFSCDNIVMSN